MQHKESVLLNDINAMADLNNIGKKEGHNDVQMQMGSSMMLADI